MKFHRHALLATALLAIGSFQQHGVAKAEVEAVPETEATDSLLLEDAVEHKFEAEVNKMLDIVINSLYTNKDIFLRELISNASDALDKLRFMSVTDPSILEGKSELEVKIGYNADQKTITITDSGIGMTLDDLVKNLGTVARSGTSKFLEGLGEESADMGMIGMFGVGFYSSFLVADKVTVASKSPEESEQHVWECVNGENTFHVGPDPRGNTLGRGTEITLHLKEESEEYANEDRLMTLTRHFSEFITHPISVLKLKTVEVDDEDDEDEFDESEKSDDELDIGDEDDSDAPEDKPKKEITTETWERVNTQKVIWTRSKDEITDKEYQGRCSRANDAPRRNEGLCETLCAHSSHFRFTNQERLVKLLRFSTSKSDGELKGVHRKHEGLLDNVREFDNHMFKDITKRFEFKDEDLIKRHEKVDEEKFSSLISWLKKVYGKEIAKITISKRLGKAPAIVTNGPYGQSAHVQQIMKSQSYAGNEQAKEQLSAMKIYRELEINPRHPIVASLLENAPEEGDDSFVTSKELRDSAYFLLDTALLSGGFALEPDEAFSNRMLRVLSTRLEVESLELEDEINSPVEEDFPPEINLERSFHREVFFHFDVTTNSVKKILYYIILSH